MVVITCANLRSNPGIRVAAASGCLLLAVGGGCARAQAVPGAPAVRADTSLAADTALLLAVLRALPRQTYHEMTFDPRVIKDDPNAVFIHPPRDFVLAEGPVVEARAAVIPRVNATRYLADDYFACSRGPGGLGRADSAGLAMRAERGPRRPYCVIAGIPRPGGSLLPDRRDRQARQRSAWSLHRWRGDDRPRKAHRLRCRHGEDGRRVAGRGQSGAVRGVVVTACRCVRRGAPMHLAGVAVRHGWVPHELPVPCFPTSLEPDGPHTV
jgi:hypothetical protein